MERSRRVRIWGVEYTGVGDSGEKVRVEKLVKFRFQSRVTR